MWIALRSIVKKNTRFIGNLAINKWKLGSFHSVDSLDGVLRAAGSHHLNIHEHYEQFLRQSHNLIYLLDQPKVYLFILYRRRVEIYRFDTTVRYHEIGRLEMSKGNKFDDIKMENTRKRAFSSEIGMERWIMWAPRPIQNSFSAYIIKVIHSGNCPRSALTCMHVYHHSELSYCSYVLLILCKFCSARIILLKWIKYYHLPIKQYLVISIRLLQFHCSFRVHTSVDDTNSPTQCHYRWSKHLCALTILWK